MMTDEVKAKLKWRCRRGMLELDLILNRFLETYWNKLSLDEQVVFERMLHEPDPDLYAWFMGYEVTDDEDFKRMVALIQRHGTP